MRIGQVTLIGGSGFVGRHIARVLAARGIRVVIPTRNRERAKRWRDVRPLEGAIYTETITFDETRDYVKKVMANAAWYARIFGRGLVSLKERLGVIPPRSDR